jgi:hypothetical protein
MCPDPVSKDKTKPQWQRQQQEKTKSRTHGLPVCIHCACIAWVPTVCSVLFWFLVYVNKLETPTADLRAELETASENLGGLVYTYKSRPVGYCCGFWLNLAGIFFRWQDSTCVYNEAQSVVYGLLWMWSPWNLQFRNSIHSVKVFTSYLLRIGLQVNQQKSIKPIKQEKTKPWCCHYD